MVSSMTYTSGTQSRSVVASVVLAAPSGESVTVELIEERGGIYVELDVPDGYTLDGEEPAYYRIEKDPSGSVEEHTEAGR